MHLSLVDRFIPGLKTNYIVLDNFKATYEAVNHFIAKGYKKIAFIAYQSSLIHMQERIRGYRQAMKDNHLEEAIQVKELLFSQAKDLMDKAMGELMEGGQKPDALLFATNALSISGLYAIKNHHIRVPEEMAVIGFDGNEAFDFFYSPLTYIEQPIEQMGKESVQILMDQIKGTAEMIQIELPHQLIERQSCG